MYTLQVPGLCFVSKTQTLYKCRFSMGPATSKNITVANQETRKK